MVRFYRLLLCLLFVSFNAAAYSGPKGLYTLEYPVNMPDVSVISENGMPIRIPSLRNDLTIMIFWSQSCFPCLREMKSLEKFYPKAAKDNIGVMLISPASEWKDNAEERKFLSLSLGIGSTPYTVIMNRSGKKVATIQGEADWNSEKLYKMIKKLIKPAQANPTAPAPLPAALPAVPASTTPASATHQAAPKPHDI